MTKIAGKQFGDRIVLACVVIFALLWITPLIWVFMLSFKPNAFLMAHTDILFSPPFTLKNYYDILGTSAVSGWIINSLGAFTESGRDYTLDVLTDHNATKAYGVTTIEKIAVAVNHDLASESGSTVAATTTLPSSARPASCEPDEVMPASAFRSTRARPVTTPMPMPMSPPATPQPCAAETSRASSVASLSRLTESPENR